MRVQVLLEPGREEIVVTVAAPALTDEVRELVRRLEGPAAGTLAGWRGERAALLDQGEVLRVYAADKSVFAWTAAGEYELRERLYELEERLDPERFVRISHSEIVNLKQVTALDLSLTGTIRMTLSDGTASYVSRRYVKRIKQVLRI